MFRNLLAAPVVSLSSTLALPIFTGRNDMTMRRAVLLCGIIASVLWFTPPRSVFACDYSPPGPPDAELAKAVAVFVGRVVQIDRSGPSINDALLVTFQVSTVWKGPREHTLAVWTYGNSALCGVKFDLGQQYLVYADGTQTDLKVWSSSRTRPVTLPDAADDLGQLGAGTLLQGAQPRLPAPTTLADMRLGAIVLSIVLLVGVPLLWRIGRRMRT